MLKKIQKLVEEEKYRFTFKAELEMARDWIESNEVLQAILDAKKIDKVINSYNLYRDRSEKLYVIKNYGLYIKGKVESDLVIISAKLDISN